MAKYISGAQIVPTAISKINTSAVVTDRESSKKNASTPTADTARPLSHAERFDVRPASHTQNGVATIIATGAADNAYLVNASFSSPYLNQYSIILENIWPAA